MRDVAKSCYESTTRRACREYIFKRDYKLRLLCGDPGEIVHHITPLSPDNINDPEIVLGDNNLVTVCRKCHGALHGEGDFILFDSQGQPCPPEIVLQKLKINRKPNLEIK